MSPGNSNGSVVTSSAVKSRPSSVAPANMPASRVTEPSAPERKKRRAPQPPGTSGTLKTVVGSPNGSVSSGYDDSLAHSTISSHYPSSPATGNRPTTVTTTGTSISQPIVKPEHTKRSAPSTPGFSTTSPTYRSPTTCNTSQVRSAAEENERTGKKQNEISMIGGVDEITLDMNEVEFVPPVRPKPPCKVSREPAFTLELTPTARKNSADTEIASLNSTEMESPAVDYQNETLAEAAAFDSIDGERHAELGQQDVVTGKEPAVDESVHKNDSSLSNSHEDIVYMTSGQNSEVLVDSDKGSLNQDHDTLSLQKSVHFFTSTDGKLPSSEISTQSTFQSQRECDVHTKPTLPGVNAVKTSEDENNSDVVTSPSLSVEQSVAAEEVTHDGQAPVNDVESQSPVTTQVEPMSFKILEKDVRQKKGELAASNQFYDTAWQSSGDGGRFRIRSVTKRVSYAEMFGKDTETRAKSPKESGGLHGSSRRPTSVAADAKLVTNPVTTIRDSEGSETDDQKPEAGNEHKGLNEIVSDNTRNFLHQQTDQQTTFKVASLNLEAELGSHEGKNIRSEKKGKASTASYKCQTTDSEPAVRVEGSHDVPSTSENVPYLDFNKPEICHSFMTASDAVDSETVLDGDTFIDKNANKSEIAPVSVSPDAEKTAAKLTDLTEDNSVHVSNSPHDDSYKGKTVQQPETIVIDKSNLSSVGGLNRRVNGASRSPSEAKMTAGTAGSASSASQMSATPGTSPDENNLQKSSRGLNVTEELPIPYKRQSSKSTVIRVVNGCIVEEPTSVASPAASKPPPTLPKTVGKNNVTVVRSDQSPSDRVSTQFKVVSNGYGAKTTDNLVKSTEGAATPVSGAENGVDIRPSVGEPIDELRTSITAQFLDSKITHASCTGDADSKMHIQGHLEKKEIVIPEWRRVTTSKFLPQAAPRVSITSGLQVSDTPTVSKPQLQSSSEAGTSSSCGRNTAYRAQSPVRSIIGGTQDQQAQLHSTMSLSSSEVTPKPSSFQHRTSVVTSRASLTTTVADSNAEEPQFAWAQARSMLRPTYKPVASEVPTSNSDSSASKFIIRSASSSRRTNFAVTDVEDRNLEHKPAQVGVSSKSIDDAVTASQTPGKTFTFMTPRSTYISSTLPLKVKNSSSTSDSDNNRHQSSVVSSPSSDWVFSAQRAALNIKQKVQSQSKPLMVLDSHMVETEKPEKGTLLPSPRSAVTSSQYAVKMTTVNSESDADSGADSNAVNPAAAALASLQPAKLRTVTKPLAPPKLTLHEQLMIAVRNAGGSVPTTSDTVPDRSKSADASSPAKTYTTSWSTSQEPSSSHASATDQVLRKPLASSAVVTAKKTPRVIESPKPTPREQLMMAIRNTGGMTSRNSPDADRSHDSITAFSSSLISTVAERPEISIAEPSSSMPPISADSHLIHGNGSSVPSTDYILGLPRPPSPPSLPPSSSVVPEAPRAAPRKLAPFAKPRATRPPQPVDAREALLTAIRDSAGGKGLRKVSILLLCFCL